MKQFVSEFAAGQIVDFFVPGGHDRVRNRAGGGRAGRHVHRDASRQRSGLRKVPDLGNSLITH